MRGVVTPVKTYGDGHDLQQLIGNPWAFDDLAASPDRVSCGGRYGVEAIALEDAVPRRGASLVTRQPAVASDAPDDPPWPRTLVSGREATRSVVTVAGPCFVFRAS